MEPIGGLARSDVCALRDQILLKLSSYPYDAFRNYPSREAAGRRPGWESHFRSRLGRMIDDPEWSFFGRPPPGGPALLAVRTALWDRAHFGFSMSAVSPVYCRGGADQMSDLLRECLAELSRAGVGLVSARINGDQTPLVHAFEDAGFRYYETVLYPVASTASLPGSRDPRVRLLAASEVERAAEIAGRHAYRRSHFYCDPAFAPEQIDQMYAKWIRTAWEAGDPIAVIESDQTVNGVFAFRIDDTLSTDLGYTYGRMRFLAVDAKARERGLGGALFRGCMHLMKAMGADYVDSGYPTKNHLSARLHGKNGFHPLHEESTFHLWI